MHGFQDILLEVWREVCRHIEIRRSAATIAGLLRTRMPLESVVVREFDAARSCLQTLTADADGRAQTPGGSRTPLGRNDLKRLAAWCRRDRVSSVRQGRAGAPDLALLLGGQPKLNWMLGPLTVERHPIGVVMVLANPGSRFTAVHEQMLQALLEPFTSALQNDHRLRELATLRESAEADKQSLLARLGRRELTDHIVGTEAGLLPVMQRVELVAKSDVPVLIFGETGTGKEVIARAIHNGSSRHDGPFIRVNCGAIPPELIDSQLFGHERGSFTGATDQRQGWFERADGGTLFLDEIGELPLAAQVRLLRIVQDGWLERVGGQEQIKVDLRVVAATHRDLTAMVRQGAFREDLWYRIAVFPILLPPLRERTQDVPALAAHFAERAAIRFGLPPQMPTERDIALMSAYAWPGNVRELATVIDRAAILGNGHGLQVAAALGSATRAEAAAPAARDVVNTSLEQTPRNEVTAAATTTLDQAMAEHIEAALRQCRGRIEGPFGAAKTLNINPHTLRARMRKLGINWKSFRPRPD